MADEKPPPPSADALAGKKLKKAVTEVKKGDFKPEEVEAVLKGWKGSFEDTSASDNYKGVNWNEKWVAKLKELKTEDEQKDFFAKGVLSGDAISS